MVAIFKKNINYIIETASNCAKLACSKGLKTRKNMTNWVGAHGPDKTPNSDFERVENCWQSRTLPNAVPCNLQNAASSAVALQNAVVAQNVAQVARENVAVARANATAVAKTRARNAPIIATLMNSFKITREELRAKHP